MKAKVFSGWPDTLQEQLNSWLSGVGDIEIVNVSQSSIPDKRRAAEGSTELLDTVNISLVIFYQ